VRGKVTPVPSEVMGLPKNNPLLLYGKRGHPCPTPSTAPRLAEILSVEAETLYPHA